jgi:hypothetical protein
MYTIEFQKRGLPHAHILLWLDNRDKLDSPDKIDSVICAELPDKALFPKLYSTVTNFMIHGPCGSGFDDSPCRKTFTVQNFILRNLSTTPHLTRVAIQFIGVEILGMLLGRKRQL